MTASSLVEPPTVADDLAPALESARGERWRPLLGTIVAVAVALALGAGLLLISGADPVSSYAALLDGAVGSRRAIELLLVQSVPLLIMGLGLCAAYRARVWNIGTEGQFQVGALGAGAFLLLTPLGSSPIAIPAAMLVGAAAGGILAWSIGALRARWEINEVVTSLLSNYVVLFGVAYVVRKPLRDQTSGASLQSERIPDVAALPTLPGSRVHIGLVLALVLVPLLLWALTRTPFGMRVRMVGMNADAAEAAGVATRSVIARTMLISGLLAGLAGAIQVMGVELRLTTSMSTGIGFTAIVVALLGRLHPLGVVFSALLIAGLSVGGNVMQLRVGVPNAVVLVIEALIVLFVVLANRRGLLAGGSR